jgi:multimeric flavodoxin WrbA
MKICILNGDMQTNGSLFTKQILALADVLHPKHQVDIFHLADMDIRHCTGCWSCWWETPGLCSHQDDAARVYYSLVHANLLVFASPLVAGFTSSTLKRMTDRIIPLLHPYLILVKGETHHRKRYSHYPDFGLVLQKEEDTDEEDIQIVGKLYDRLALNFHARKRFIKFIDQDKMEDIAYAIDTV